MAAFEEHEFDSDVHDDVVEDVPDIRKNLYSELSDHSPVKSADTDCMPPPPSQSTPSDNMNIFLRVRPLSEEEKKIDEEQGCVTADGSTVNLCAPKSSKAFSHAGGQLLHSFSFNRVYDEYTSQKVLFEDAMLDTVKEFVDGQNCLVFAYGVTNSGKTYTMLGPAKEPGIIPRSLEVIFNSVGERQYQQSDLKPQLYCQVKRLTSAEMAAGEKFKTTVINTATKTISDFSDLSSSCDSIASQSSIGESLIDGIDGDPVRISTEDQGDIKFSVWVSFAEVYNEQIFDLLEAPTKNRRKILMMKEDRNANPYIKDLREVHVCSSTEAAKVMAYGRRNLQYACTKLNESSSRSHCIFTVKIVRVADVLNPRKVQISRLSFCDLAGSERYARTGNMGDRLKEAANINTSLLTLGRCVHLLRQNQQGRTQKVVPYRESKLTRLFQSYFCGKGRASMFVNINPAASSFDENLQVFKFSAIAKQVKVISLKVASHPVNIGKKTEVSLALEQCQESRDTIQWGTADDLEESTTEEDSEECTITIERYQVAIDKLKQALIDTNELLKQERKANKKMESRLRTEIAKEMMQQITEIETGYQQQIDAHKQRYEDAADKKVQIITSAVKKSVKRKRIEEEEEMNDVIGSLQVKLDRKEFEMEELREELKQAKENTAITKNEDMDITKNEIFIRMTQQLEVATTTLKEKEAMIQEMEETLDEAKETFQMKESSIETLTDNNKELATEKQQLQSEIENLASQLAQAKTHMSGMIVKKESLFNNLGKENVCRERNSAELLSNEAHQVSATCATPYKAMHTKSSLLRLHAAHNSPCKVDRCLDGSCFVNIGPHSHRSKPSRLASDTRATKKRTAAITKRRVSNVFKRVYETRSRVKK